MAESMKDYETELEASFKKIEEGDILTGTVISVDEKEVVVDLKYYAEGIIPAEDYSREPGFSLKEQVNVGDEVSATVVSKDDGNGNILLSRTEAADVLAWDKLKTYMDEKTDLTVKVGGVKRHCKWRRDRLCRRCTWIYSRLKACPELCGGYKRISEQTNPGSGFRY